MEARNWGRDLAKASLAAPLIAWLVSCLTRRPDEGPWVRAGQTFVVAAAWSLVAFGVVAAIWALARVKRDGRRGIVLEASLGLAINAALAGFIAWTWLGPRTPTATPVAADQWVNYEPPGGQFRVRFPGTPTAGTIGEGDAMLRTAVVRLADGTWFTADYAVVATPTDDPDETARLLDLSVERFSSTATLLEKRDAPLGRHAGREAKYRDGDGALVTRRTYAANGRFHVVMVGSSPKLTELHADQFREFLDSFTIVEPEGSPSD